MTPNSPTDPTASTYSSGILETGIAVIALDTFYILNWVFFGLCTISFAIRAYIRYASFRRFLVEDYLMLFALSLLTSEAVLAQLYVHHLYDLEAAGKGDISKITADFFTNSKKGLTALGTCLNLIMVGVLAVKINFLLFFRRLGQAIRMFNVAWWAILIFTVAVTIAQIGMQQFGCFFNDMTYVFSKKCTDEAAFKRTFFNTVFSAIADALSDLLIVGLPITILWKSGISKRKKFILSLVFGLVFLTIAITIIRGSVFHEVYDNTSSGGKVRMQSTTFTLFWFHCEFSIAFIIACIVSFRTLFVQRRHGADEREQVKMRHEEHHQSALRRGMRARARQFYDSVLDTCRTFEGVSDTESHLSKGGLPGVPTGLMTLNFNDDSNWRKNFDKERMYSTRASDEGLMLVSSPPKTYAGS